MYVADEQERGPKGKLDTSSPVGRCVGVRGMSYRVLKANGQTVERAPQHVRCLDEEPLVDKGIPDHTHTSTAQHGTVQEEWVAALTPAEAHAHAEAIVAAQARIADGKALPLDETWASSDARLPALRARALESTFFCKTSHAFIKLKNKDPTYPALKNYVSM